MLLQQIVEILDKELERLHRLRGIVSELSHSVAIEKVPDTLSDVSAIGTQEAGQSKDSVEVATTRPETAPRRSVKRATVKPAMAAALEKIALSGPIPAAPVVVSAAALARENAAKQQARSKIRVIEPEKQTGTLGSMIRALGLDRTA